MTDNAEIATTETHSHLMATAQIVAAWIPRASSDLTVESMIEKVRKALVSPLVKPQPEPSPLKEPAVPIKKSVTDDWIICLEDGKRFKSLKRHLRTAYGMTPEQYRDKWGLPESYPMTAANYSLKRSQLAKANGLGRKVGA